MKIGVIGLPQTGKKMLFELLTGQAPSESELASGKPIKGVAHIKDTRFDDLVTLYKPKKDVRARIDIELLPKVEKDAIQKGEIFEEIAEFDAICHVVRAFENDSVYHVDGTIDPIRDIDFVNGELILHDLIFIEKRLERIDKKIKATKDEQSAREKDALEKLKACLEKELPLRMIEISEEDLKIVGSYPLITRKEMIIVLNVDEQQAKATNLVDNVNSKYKNVRLYAMQVSAKVEAEIAHLESDEERQEFLAAMGVVEPALSVLAGLCIKALNLISFFTVGQDEVRQWLIKKGSSAPQAAGAIHTDLQKGFIRAEVMKFSDIKNLGSEEKVKSAGKFLLKGKDYNVEDGDILTIRFNV